MSIRRSQAVLPQLASEPAAAVQKVGLRYVTDRMPGIRRKKAGQGFRYRFPTGDLLRDEEPLKRIKALVIAPARTDVWLCPYPCGHLQATGRDARHRKEHRYHARWRNAAKQTARRSRSRVGHTTSRLLTLFRLSILPMRELSPLPRAFFYPSAQVVAPLLLGHWLIRRTERGVCGGPIVETEAYLKDDPACHGAPGLTARNRIMFGPPGYGYVYLIYGYHFCVNAVCQPAGTAEAVLIRALEADIGVELMQEKRPVSRTHHLTNGPAKLCQAMQIERELDGVDLCDGEGPLFIARNPAITEFRNQTGPVLTTTRVGITRAAELRLRFYLERSRFVSKRERKNEKRKT